MIFSFCRPLLKDEKYKTDCMLFHCLFYFIIDAIIVYIDVTIYGTKLDAIAKNWNKKNRFQMRSADYSQMISNGVIILSLCEKALQRIGHIV